MSVEALAIDGTIAGLARRLIVRLSGTFFGSGFSVLSGVCIIVAMVAPIALYVVLLSEAINVRAGRVLVCVATGNGVDMLAGVDTDM